MRHHPGAWVPRAEFQSTPGIAAGRCGAVQRLLVGKDVSIHARHCCRAMPDHEIWVDSWAHVSIHARHCCRAMRGRLACLGSLSPCFNPRPALLPGDAGSKRLLQRFCDVSIHARHCCRAMLPNMRPVTPHVLFQSTPGIAAGRCCKPDQDGTEHHGFNPRPALLPGDAISKMDHGFMPIGFNPRPALLPGDANSQTVNFARLTGFNPRPALLPGDAPASKAASCSGVFQSTPGIAAGRC